MSNHEAIEAGVLSGVALLFVLAIVLVASVDNVPRAAAGHSGAVQAEMSGGGLPNADATR
jgi:hypothetical protein